MNRLSFLKTLGVGIAATVITPKILADLPHVLKANETEGIIPYIERTSEYGHYEEDIQHLTVDSLRVNDLCADRDARAWLCTAMMFDTIELTALTAEPLPNRIDVQRSAFDEYFIIMGNSYSSKP